MYLRILFQHFNTQLVLWTEFVNLHSSFSQLIQSWSIVWCWQLFINSESRLLNLAGQFAQSLIPINAPFEYFSNLSCNLYALMFTYYYVSIKSQNSHLFSNMLIRFFISVYLSHWYPALHIVSQIMSSSIFFKCNLHLSVLISVTGIYLCVLPVSICKYESVSLSAISESQCNLNFSECNLHFSVSMNLSLWVQPASISEICIYQSATCVCLYECNLEPASICQ